MRTRTVTVATGLLVVLGGWTGVTQAAFSSQAQNAGNHFEAAPSFCGGQTMAAIADTYLDQQSGATNYGSSAQLLVRRHPNWNQRTLVRFDLPPVPADCRVVSAELRLYATSATAGSTLQAFRLASGWGEMTATWQNQPATVGSAASAPSAVGWVSFPVTAHVEEMYVGSNHGFLVRDSTEGSSPARSQTYSSREAGTPPQLVVTFG